MAQTGETIDKLIIHGLIVTMDPDHSLIEDGAIAISGSKIVSVGPTRKLVAQYSASETIDASNQIVMPGLISAHTHCPAVLFRGLVEDVPLYAWLDRMWKAEKQFLSPDTVRAGARLAYFEMIRGGTTTALDMYWFPEVSAEVARQVGFRLMTGPVYLDTEDPQDGIPIEKRTERGRAFLQEYLDDPLIVPCVQPHSTYTVPPDFLLEARALADEFGVIYHTHASESEDEVADVVKRYGKTPINHLEALGLLDDRTVLAHCVHLSDQEITLLAERGAVSVHNPLSNLKIGSGIARVPSMLQAGIPVLLGVDGPQSGNDLDMWLAMRLAAILHKGNNQDPTLLPAPDVVKMATCDVAEALGLGERIGSLEVGKLADIILIDLHKPHLVPLYDLYAHLVYAIGREDVTTVLINGQVVMRDRQMLTLDEEETLGDVNKIGHQIAAATAKA